MKSLLLASSLMTFFVSPTAAFSAGKSRVFVGTPVHQNRRLVDDCMTHLSSLCTLTESSTVDEAVYMLLDLDVSGAPVINKDTGELLGIVSTFDFLQQEAGDGALLPIQGTLENVHAYLNQAKKVSSRVCITTHDFTRKSVITRHHSAQGITHISFLHDTLDLRN